MTGSGRGVASALALATVLALVAGCGGEPAGRSTPDQVTGSATGTPGGAPSAGASGPATGTPAAVPEALTFTGRTLDGKPFRGADLAGRPVVLWFWAPWCATCAGQAASVADMAAAHGDRVGIVGVAGLGAAPAMRDFVTEFELGGVPQLDDRAGEVWRKFEVTEQSTYVILDETGREVHRGWLDSLRFEETVASLAAA
ncbi:TlpA family protein disulfide reductase [Plantactinospora sp. GCM10030261]|uniref:TlpA family protein disulfide reductase n=1 Tax=Plantactinospora sp. GCM10030261 TaxID=3273420 RepID=UPI003620207A